VASIRRKVLVVTALPVEREAVLEHLREVQEAPHPQGSIYRRGVFDENSDPWDVLVAEIGAGNEGAAAEAERAIRYFDPEVAIFVGVAGAIKDFRRGDVVASTKVYNYESGKDCDQGFEPRPETHLAAYSLRERARYEAGEPHWRQRIKARASGANSKAIDNLGEPAAGLGPIAAGPKILASTRSAVYAFIRQNYGDAVIVEMEGYGFLRSVHMNPSVQGIVIRGVSDHLCDKAPEADKGWQPIAARHAAAFAFQILSKFGTGTNAPDRTGSLGRTNERQQRLEWAWRASIARCVERWQALGVPLAEAVALATDEAVGAPATDVLPSTDQPLRVIVGELGVGKSLGAERWHQQAIKAALQSATAPVPVHIEVDAAITDLVVEIDRRTEGLGEWRTCGVALSLDRLERAGHGGAERLLQEARRLVVTYPGSAALLTSRHLPRFDVEEAVRAGELNEAEASALVSRFAGRSINPFAFNQWPESLRSAIRRPLFAILTGLDLAESSHRGRSVGGLLARLVERALGGGTGLDEQLLRKLAIKCVDTGYGSIRAADLGSNQAIGRLIGSSLVVPRNGTLAFSLDILTDWFAAHALAEAEVNIDELVSDVSRLERWRYPLAIAVGLFPHDVVSKLLRPLASRQPGFASQVVDEAMARYASPDDPGLPATPPSAECGEKLREAMAGWTSGLGVLAELIAPVDTHGQVFPISVYSDGVALSVSWRSPEKELPDVSEVPGRFSLRNQLRRSQGIHWARPASASAWAWSWALDELSGNLRTLVERRQLPLLAGPLVDEEVWHQALILGKKSGPFVADRISVQDLREKVRSYGPGVRLRHWDGLDYDFSELSQRIETLDVEPYLMSPWPAPDLPMPYSRFVWSGYSKGRLRVRTQAVLEGALIIYQQLVGTYLPKFCDRLGLAGLLPIRLVVYPLSTEDPSVAEKSPWWHWHFEPLPYGEATHVTVSAGGSIAQEPEDFLHRLYDRVQKQRPRSWRWLHVALHRGRIDVFGDRPATRLAYAWLKDDLKAVHWLG
jgi:nucleoside phosphorylase